MLDRSASRAQARGGLSAAAAFLERAAALTLDSERRAERALAAAQVKYQAGAFDATLGLLSTAEAGPLNQLRRARADRLRGHVAFASSRGSDAPPLLLKAARQFEPLDLRLARETYLDALGAATFSGRLALGSGLREVAEAARTAPPPPGPAGGSDLLTDGLALLVTEGYPAGAPVLRQAVSYFGGTDVSREERLPRLWLAGHVASIVWDYASWDALSGRHLTLALEVGALSTLPIVFNTRAGVHLFAGEFAEAASVVAQAESVTEATGSSIAPYGALALAVFQGREAQAAHLIQTVTEDVGRRGEGAGLSFAQWAAARAGMEHARPAGPGGRAAVLRVAGAGLLIATGAIHLDLYLTGYRTIPTIGWLFLLQVIAAFGLGLAVLATGGLPVIAGRLAAAGAAGFALATLGGYLPSVWTGLFGFHEVRTTAGIVAGVIEVAAFAVLAALALDPARADAAAKAPAGGSAATPARFGARIPPAITRAAATTAAALAVAALVLLGVAVAGASPPAPAATDTGLKTTTIGGMTVLTNARGLTLYWFAPDTPAASKCYGSCAAYWPPVTGTAAAGRGLPGRIGTITRTDGSRQLTYDGHPLYTYIGDTAPGPARGNNLNLNGGLWLEVRVSRP